MAMLRNWCLLLSLSAASAFVALPPSRAAARTASAASMSQQPLGYQTEAAGSQAILREMQLQDDIMLLRVAAGRAAIEKDPTATATLLNKCATLQSSIKQQLLELHEQQKDLTDLLRSVTQVAESGKRVRGFDFDMYLEDLVRELQ